MKGVDKLSREELARRVERLELQLQLAQENTPTRILEPFFSLSLDLMCTAGLDGYFKRVNSVFEETFGYSEREMLSRPIIDFVHPDDREGTMAEFTHLEAGLRSVRFVNRYICKDESIRWIEWNGAMPKGGRRGIIYAVARDITKFRQNEEALKRYAQELEASHEELRSMQLQLIQAEKLESLGRLSAGVAHEVKNPLAMLQLGLDYCKAQLHEGEGADEDDLKVLETMQESIQRADTIIRGMLDYAATTRLELKLRKINPVVREALRFAKHEAVRNNVVMEVDFASDLPRVRIDKQKILQVILNLITNALQEMEGGGWLRVRTYAGKVEGTKRDEGARTGDRLRAGHDAVFVDIQDNGPGISEDQIGRIFDPFFTTKATGKGTGLGLAVSRGIVELHKGLIEITNRPQGGVRSRLILRAAQPKKAARVKVD
ncbi:MAG: ATP-binding protein [Verrucomicrobiota bacterium]